MKTLLCFVSVLFTVQVFAKVKITLPKHQFKRHEQIDVALTNTGQQSVSFCVEFGQWSYKSETEPLVTTPTPVYVQQHTEKGWSVLLNGPDIGSSRHAVVLATGETQQYPFRLSDTGKMRIILNYWTGESDDVCANASRRKTTRSVVFLVQ
jgi:hypothetical protein